MRSSSSSARGSAGGIRPVPQDGQPGAERQTRPTCNRCSCERKTCLQPPNLSRKRSTEGGKKISVKLPFEVVTGEIPPELLPRLQRDFIQEERDAIYMRCGRSLAPKVLEPDRPGVLFVLGPSAVGKSYITDASASQLFDNAHNAVILDGEYFREVKHSPALWLCAACALPLPAVPVVPRRCWRYPAFAG